jgi:hypothetical protein
VSAADTKLPAFVNVASSDRSSTVFHVNDRSSTADGAITTMSFISVAVSARVRASSLESIHRGGDRPAGERDAPPDLIDRL